MPFAKGVSAKSNRFDLDGNEATIDFPKMIKIVKASNFSGYIGIEWGGGRSPSMPAKEGILATKRLLQKLLPGLK